jgi:hypothetical protein
MRYAMRPDIVEKWGYLWPDGIPEIPPPIEQIYVSCDTKDQNGKNFKIAYTEEQVEQQVKIYGWFSPYYPLFVSKT